MGLQNKAEIPARQAFNLGMEATELRVYRLLVLAGGFIASNKTPVNYSKSCA